MGKITISKDDNPKWGVNTNFNEVERVISSNTRSLSECEINTMIERETDRNPAPEDNGQHKK